MDRIHFGHNGRRTKVRIGDKTMKNKNKGRQRQRTRQRFVWLVIGSILVSASIVTTIVIHSLRIERSRAHEQRDKTMRLVEDEGYITDFSIDAPVVRPENENDEKVIGYKKIKLISSNGSK